MDTSGKTGGSALSGNWGPLAILLLAAGAFVLHEAPLQGTRPAANEPKIDQRFAEQDVDARLWQDPFGAVERGRDELAKKLAADALKAENERHGPKSLTDLMAVKATTEDVRDRVTEVDVVAVMVPGGPYSEQVELRRRARYAVLAGFNSSRYAPVDTEHIGYFVPAGNAELPYKLPKVVPYEWFEPAPDRPDPACPSQESHVAASAAKPGCQLRHVLVLWLDSGAFAKRPFERLAQLFEQITPPKQLPVALRWRVLGPPDSGGLRAMVEESSSPRFDADFFRSCDVRFYSPLATAPDAILLERVASAAPPAGPTPDRPPRACARPAGAIDTPSEPADGELTLARFFGNKGISFVRTIGDDRHLSMALSDELNLRIPRDDDGKAATRSDICTNPGPDSPPHIAVVTELDTLYGRSLRRQFRYDAATDQGFCVKRYQYARGIDGQLPDRGSSASPPTAKDAAGGKGDPGKDSLLIERAEGQSQFDYLRRLAARMREQDSALRASGQPGIRAIGVLGNDLHDKLLVLQALRPEFPGAIFFTTDLDVRFLHPREQEWTRNLIVASNFGLRLNDRLQSGAPPFRDGYQTSTFFATRLAMAEINSPQPFRWTQAQALRSLQGPRIFEIGRTEAFDFSAPAVVPAVAPASPAPAASSPPPLAQLTAMMLAPAATAPTTPASFNPPRVRGCGNSDFAACNDVHPPPSRAWPDVRLTTLAIISLALLLSLWAPALALSRSSRRRVRRFLSGNTSWLLRSGVVGLVIAVHIALPLAMARAWPDFAHWLTFRGKPISLTEGISIWPTEAIRLLTLLLCIYLVFRGWAALTRNIDDISLRLRLGKTRRQLVVEQQTEEEGQAWWQKVVNMFMLRSPYMGTPPESLEEPRMSPGALAFWKRYLVQNRTVARFARASLCVLVTAALGTLASSAIDDVRGLPVRGDVSSNVHDGLSMAVYLLMNFLIFYVADATLLCVRFVRELRWHSTNWPERTQQFFQSRIGPLPPPLIDHWVDLQFIAMRTRIVTRLVYYPFVVLSLLLLSRSEVFDNWHMPLSLQLLSLASLGIVLACIVALRRAAENSRSRALADVKETMLRAQARDAKDLPAPQQLDLLRKQIEELREGAFAPFAQQPLLKALLMPFATLGGTVLLDYMSMASI